MTVGSFAGVAFYVSDATVQTISNLEWSASATYSTHKRHLYKDLPEMTGIDLQSLTFDMELNEYLGANPLNTYKDLQRACESGRVSSFILGGQRIGGQWVCKSVKMKSNQLGAGDVISATVSATLQEYV